MPTAGQESKRSRNSHCEARSNWQARAGCSGLFSLSLTPSHPSQLPWGETAEAGLGSDNRIRVGKEKSNKNEQKKQRKQGKQQVTREIHALPESNAMGESRRQRGCRETEMAHAFQFSLTGTLQWSWMFIQMPLWRQLPPRQSSNKGIAPAVASEENLVFPWTFSTRTGGKAYSKGKYIIYHSNWDTLKEQKIASTNCKA